MEDNDKNTVSDQEAIALARCYRLLIEKAAECRQHNNNNAEAALNLIEEPENDNSNEHGSESGQLPMAVHLPDKRKS